MRYLSVCSGIEAASVAWHPLGWEPVAFAEVEPFPSAVLAHHYPNVPNLGDMTRYEEWPDATFDVLVGGTPCQSFSVAGKRGGMDDPRGQLAYSFAGIAARYRPEWIVWENVPGVLSSNGGRDFAGFVRGLGELGYQCAWRIFDAQFFGVPQRRRRLFLIGNSGGWQRAAAVLFERESMLGNPPPSRKAREVAPTSPARSTGGGGLGSDFDCDGEVITMAHGQGGAEIGFDRGPTLTCNHEAPILAHVPEVSATLVGRSSRGGGQINSPGHNADQSIVVTHSLRGEGFDASGDGTGRGTPLVPVHAFDARQSDVIQYGDMTGPLDTDGHSVAVAFSSKDYGGDAGELAPTLRAMGHGASHANGGGQVAVAFDTTQITSRANYSNPKPGDPCHPLAAGAHAPAVAFKHSMGSKAHGIGYAEEQAPTLGTDAANNAVMQSMQVRRLTPVECERLQGFPDNYTAIPWRNKPASECPDGPRYKALGNSMAVPVMRWIGQRIDKLMEMTR